MKPKDIISKEPFVRVQPYLYNGGTVRGGTTVQPELPKNLWTAIPQEKFLSELSPSGHGIYLKPDKKIEDENGNLMDHQAVSKIAVALQEVISTKQKIHLATNPIKFVLTEEGRSDAKEKEFTAFKQAWIDKNMHVALSESIESWLDTGDTALYFFRNKDKMGWRQFGFKKGDVLLPHYDEFGELKLFGRMYSGLDEGKDATKLDVFDETEVVTYIKKGFFGTNMMQTWKEIKGSRKKHGFSTVPICYKRSNDVCWGSVQPLIDSFEWALSNMSENNRYYANAILFLKGEIEALPNRDDSGKVLVASGEDASAEFLATPESNQAMMNELDILLKQIFMGSFTVSVSPDTVKSSGDLPGITVKLLFSPATEKALDSANKLEDYVDRMVLLFKEAYGIESGKYTNFNSLKVRGSIDVYVPQNDAELNRMINDSVLYKTLSKETAAQINTLGVSGEYERLKSEIAMENAGSLNIEE